MAESDPVPVRAAEALRPVLAAAMCEDCPDLNAMVERALAALREAAGLPPTPVGRVVLDGVVTLKDGTRWEVVGQHQWFDLDVPGAEPGDVVLLLRPLSVLGDQIEGEER